MNVSNEPKEPKNGKDAGNNGSKFSRFVDKLVWPVSAGLVLASILGGFAYVRPNFGF